MLNIPPHQKPVKQMPNETALKVYHQLIPDFPGHAIQWVKDTFWVGPVEVPLHSIDTENRANWAASHELDKVKLHQELIQNGESKPIILGKFPGHDKLIIIDAHHRFLAYEAMAKNPVAYVGNIKPEYTEQAMTAHHYQYSGRSKLNGT